MTRSKLGFYLQEIHEDYLLRKRSMTLSTWIRTLAIALVVSTSTGSSCSLPLVKAGTTNFALLNAILSCMVKPRSAIIMSPGTNLLKIPQFSVKNLSEVLPPHASETNEMLPCSVIPIKTMMVTICLFLKMPPVRQSRRLEIWKPCWNQTLLKTELLK